MSEKRAITFEVDTVKMFEAVSSMGGDLEPVGARLASLLLGGPDWREEIGLAVYGITVAAHHVPNTTEGQSPVQEGK